MKTELHSTNIGPGTLHASFTRLMTGPPARHLAATVAVGLLFAFLTSCELRSGPPDSEMSCVGFHFLENRSYTATNGSEGPPFPYYRHSFCTSEERGEVSYSFALSDARKTVHAVFTLGFSDFEETGISATARYRRSTFRVITDFAEGNALSKWLNCRDAIRSRTEFVMDDCLEVGEPESIVRIGPGEPGAPGRGGFPCGINVGPDSVRDHPGDTVPDDVYSGERSSLTGMLAPGTPMSLRTDERIEGVYVPEIFFRDLTFSTELSACAET